MKYTQSIVNCVNGLNYHQLEGLKGDGSEPLEMHVNAWLQEFAPASYISGCTPTDSTPASSGGGSFEGYLTLILFPLTKYF